MHDALVIWGSLCALAVGGWWWEQISELWRSEKLFRRLLADAFARQAIEEHLRRGR